MDDFRAKIEPVDIEVWNPSKKSYQWQQGYKVVHSSGELQPYFRTLSEAKNTARSLGYTIVNNL